MTIYLDIILLENIFMNFIILFASAYILKVHTKIFRIIISSFIGGVYAILTYLNISNLYENILMKIILSISMVYIAFKPKSIKGLLKELILFYLVSFALGGCAFALLYIVKPGEILILNGVYIGTYPIKIALLGGFVGVIITYVGFRVVKSKVSKNEIIYKIEIKIEDKYQTTNVLLDTGNMLKDPITKSPVILLEKSILSNLLPVNLIKIMEEANGGDINEVLETYKKRIRIIPFTSVGKQNGMMIGIKADEIKIITDINEVINKDGIICMYNKSFSKNNRYFGLIGIELLEGREENEYFENVKG